MRFYFLKTWTIQTDIFYVFFPHQHALRYLAFGQTWKVLGLQDDKIAEEEEEEVEEATKRQADGKEEDVPDTKKIKVEAWVCKFCWENITFYGTLKKSLVVYVEFLLLRIVTLLLRNIEVNLIRSKIFHFTLL